MEKGKDTIWMDWPGAEVQLNKKIYQHGQLIGTPQANPFPALMMMGVLKEQLQKGERSSELYEAILALE